MKFEEFGEASIDIEWGDFDGTGRRGINMLLEHGFGDEKLAVMMSPSEARDLADKLIKIARGR